MKCKICKHNKGVLIDYGNSWICDNCFNDLEKNDYNKATTKRKNTNSRKTTFKK